jgi:hypothetical protein
VASHNPESDCDQAAGANAKIAEQSQIFTGNSFQRHLTAQYVLMSIDFM